MFGLSASSSIWTASRASRSASSRLATCGEHHRLRRSSDHLRREVVLGGDASGDRGEPLGFVEPAERAKGLSEFRRGRRLESLLTHLVQDLVVPPEGALRRDRSRRLRAPRYRGMTRTPRPSPGTRAPPRSRCRAPSGAEPRRTSPPCAWNDPRTTRADASSDAGARDVFGQLVQRPASLLRRGGAETLREEQIPERVGEEPIVAAPTCVFHGSARRSLGEIVAATG